MWIKDFTIIQLRCGHDFRHKVRKIDRWMDERCSRIHGSEEKNGKFSAIRFTLHLFEVIWKTAADQGETFTQSCAETYEGFLHLTA